MSKAHLTYFRVSNFKKFEDLELTNLGQFNLVVGDNNVGKTSLLEALLVDENNPNYSLMNFCKALLFRSLDFSVKYAIEEKNLPTKKTSITFIHPKENYLSYYFGQKDIPLILVQRYNSLNHSIITLVKPISQNPGGNNLSVRVNLLNTDDSIGSLNLNKLDFLNETSDFNFEKNINFDLKLIYSLFHGVDLKSHEIPLLSTAPVSTHELTEGYFKLLDVSRKEKSELINLMRFILEDIEDFEIRKINHQEHLMVGLTGHDEFRPIGLFGESVTRATYLLLQIARYKGRRLMIDEVDTGIHHTRLKQFMKTLVQVSDKYEVQLFMTTHSLECQHAFADALLSEDMAHFQQEARNVTLFVNKEGKTAAQTFDFESFRFALETNFETRGG